MSGAASRKVGYDAKRSKAILNPASVELEGLADNRNKKRRRAIRRFMGSWV